LNDEQHPRFKAYTYSQVRAWSSKGGSAKVPKGFASNLALASEAGIKGGQNSWKNRSVIKVNKKESDDKIK
jgi:general stress protein YciG